MSRIGKLPVTIPEGVTVTVKGGEITAKGGGGTLTIMMPKHTNAKVEDGRVLIENTGGALFTNFHGLSRTLVANLLEGVSKGYEKKLEITGVGYRASVKDNLLTLNVGFSHPVNIEAPAGVSFLVEKNIITVSGADKQLVGETAARVRASKKPEPYKGKGIRYIDERVRRKAGKSAAKGVKAE